MAKAKIQALSYSRLKPTAIDNSFINSLSAIIVQQSYTINMLQRKFLHNMENYITLSHLNDFIFCPRSIYFHQLYSKYNEQHYKQKPQIEGSAAHAAVDTKKYSSRKTVLQALEVYTAQYNIVGKIDVFDTSTGRLTERKNNIVQIYDGYIFQVYAQYFGLTEMGYDVKEIVIYDMSANKNYPIALPTGDNPMLLKFEQIVTDISQYNMSNASFVPNIEKCKKCIYSPLCDKSLC